jgi:hypothetical protein
MDQPTIEELRAAIKHLELRDDHASKVCVIAAKNWVERLLALNEPTFLAQALQKMNQAMEDSVAEDGHDVDLENREPDSYAAGVAVRNAAEAWLMLEWREGFPESHLPVALAHPNQKNEHVAFMPLSLLPPLPNVQGEQAAAGAFVESVLRSVELEDALIHLPEASSFTGYFIARGEVVFNKKEDFLRLRTVFDAAMKWQAYQRKLLGVDSLQEDRPAPKLSIEELQAMEPMQIKGFAHCARCVVEKPRGVSPREWTSLEMGATDDGIQVWCKRHNMNVIHVRYKEAFREHLKEHEHEEEHPDQPDPPSDELIYAIKEFGATVETMKEDLAKGIENPVNTYLHVIKLHDMLEPFLFAVPAFARVMAQRGEIGCSDCGRRYSLGPDLVVSDEDWLRIAPKVDGGGVLCPNCMNDRFAKLQDGPHEAGNIRAVFTSGPFSMSQPTPTGLLWDRIRFLRLAITSEKPEKGSNLDLALDKDLQIARESELLIEKTHA